MLDVERERKRRRKEEKKKDERRKKGGWRTEGKGEKVRDLKQVKRKREKTGEPPSCLPSHLEGN